MKVWVKEHFVEVIGVAAAVGLLVFVWMGKKTASVVAPAAAIKTDPVGTNIVTSDQLEAVQKQLGQALAAMGDALSQAEQQDVKTITAQLQKQSADLTSVQTSLTKLIADTKSQLEAAIKAGDTAQAAALQAQAAAYDTKLQLTSAQLSALQAATAASIDALQSGQVSNQQQISNLINQLRNGITLTFRGADWRNTGSVGGVQIGV